MQQIVSNRSYNMLSFLFLKMFMKFEDQLICDKVNVFKQKCSESCKKILPIINTLK